MAENNPKPCIKNPALTARGLVQRALWTNSGTFLSVTEIRLEIFKTERRLIHRDTIVAALAELEHTTPVLEISERREGPKKTVIKIYSLK